MVEVGLQKLIAEGHDSKSNGEVQIGAVFVEISRGEIDSDFLVRETEK